MPTVREGRRGFLLAASLYPEIACTLLDLGTLRLSNREIARTLYMSPRGFSAI